MFNRIEAGERELYKPLNPSRVASEPHEQKKQRNQHMEEAHGAFPDKKRGESKDAAATSMDASASTGSVTEETNESPSAAEPAEAAGPPENDGDVRPDTDDDEE